MKYVYKTKPWKHQHRELKRLLKRGWGGLLWEPGTGKTKVIVDWASALHMMGRCKRVLIVCPKSVKGVWEDEFLIHSPLVGDYKVHVIEPDTEYIPRYSTKLSIAVINYDLIWRRDTMIQGFDPQMVVCDESHRIKKPSSRRSRYMRTWNDAPYRAILTGTPTPKSYLDIYAQWVFLNYKRFGTKVKDFKERYIRYGGYMNKQIMGYMYFDELKEKMRKDASSIELRDVLDLPPEIMQRIPIVLEPRVREMYRTLEQEYFLELENGAIIDSPNMLSKREKLTQITGGWVNTEQGLVQVSEAKIEAAKDLLEDRWERQEKVVVFARYIPETDALIEAAKNVGYKHVFVMRGDVKQKDRDAQRRQFQSMKEPACFVIQIQTGGLGITLHAAHEVIFYSVTEALDDYIQAIGRIRRGGQKHKMIFRHIVARDTIDADKFAALKLKEDVQKRLMQGIKRRAA